LKWFDEYLRRFRPAEHYAAASMDMARRRAERDMRLDDRDQARTEELNNLRLALAMFAVQLDMFEMRLRRGPLRAYIEAGTGAPLSDGGGRHPSKNRP
jgi:hypothetical protein